MTRSEKRTTFDGMEHNFLYDLAEGLVILILLYDVYTLKKRVKRLETQSKTERSEGEFWERYKKTAPRQ